LNGAYSHLAVLIVGLTKKTLIYQVSTS